MEKHPTPTPTTHHSSWPGAFGIYAPSREAMMRNLSTLLLLVLIILIGSTVLSAIFRHSYILNQLVALVFSAYATSALVHATIASVRGKHVELSDALRVSPQLVLNMFLLSLLIGLSLLGGLLLLIVPAFIILPRLVLAPYFLVDKDLGVIEAYKASWNASRGRAGIIYGIIGVTILMILPALTIIGIPVTAYFVFMYTASTALLYEYAKKRHHS
jgi:hypothetical protein